MEEPRAQEVITSQPAIDVTHMTPEVVDDEPSHTEIVALGGEITPAIAVFEVVAPMAEELCLGFLSLGFLGCCPHFLLYPDLWKVIPFFILQAHSAYVRSIVY